MQLDQQVQQELLEPQEPQAQPEQLEQIPPFPVLQARQVLLVQPDQLCILVLVSQCLLGQLGVLPKQHLLATLLVLLTRRRFQTSA